MSKKTRKSEDKHNNSKYTYTGKYITMFARLSYAINYFDQEISAIADQNETLVDNTRNIRETLKNILNSGDNKASRNANIKAFKVNLHTISENITNEDLQCDLNSLVEKAGDLDKLLKASVKKADNRNFNKSKEFKALSTLMGGLEKISKAQQASNTQTMEQYNEQKSTAQSQLGRGLKRFFIWLAHIFTFKQASVDDVKADAEMKKSQVGQGIYIPAGEKEHGKVKFGPAKPNGYQARFHADVREHAENGAEVENTETLAAN